MNVTDKINRHWAEYDQTIATCQLINYGIIFLDEYGLPIDNEYEWEDLYKEWCKQNN